MPIIATRSILAQTFNQRCFYLFAALIGLICLLPIFGLLTYGRVLAATLNVFILLAAVAAFGYSVTSFVAALIMAGPALVLQLVYILEPSDAVLLWSRLCTAGFYMITITYLMHYVLRPNVMDIDKLYGAAAAFLMLGILWAHFYLLALHFDPAAIGAPSDKPMDIVDAIYFSFSTLTTTGFGDFVAQNAFTRILVTLEQVIGTLFVAILIARLAGVYPIADTGTKTPVQVIDRIDNA